MAEGKQAPTGKQPITLNIKFKSDTLEQFIARYAVDVSEAGIFIRTKEPLAVGTQMKFVFQLSDASPLIAGDGTVVWTRDNDPSRPAIAPGMGVRFDRLTDRSPGVLEHILTEKAKLAPPPDPTPWARSSPFLLEADDGRFREANSDNPFAVGTRQGDLLLEREPQDDDTDDDDVMWLAVADVWSRSLDELQALKSELTDLSSTLESRTGE